MSRGWLGFLLLITLGLWGQDPVPDVRTVGLEEFAQANVSDWESQQVRLEFYRRHPVDLNRATADELSDLGLISAGQIENWLQFRGVFGPAADWHVFQAVPGWTESTVISLKPYSFLTKPPTSFRALMREPGRHWMLTRLNWTESRALPQASIGSAVQALFRYQFFGARGLQVGLTVEKDAGEPWWRKGPDFWSLHFKWTGRRGMSWLVGDYAIQLGQGLACWQSMGFGAGAELTAIKQQALTIRPYQSVGESRFMRGVAVGKTIGSWQWTAFLSSNPQTATLYDWEGGGKVFRQVDASGLHRTAGERVKKNILNEYTVGGRVGRQYRSGRIFFNLVTRGWSLPRLGDVDWISPERIRFNATVDLSITRGPVHAFGEWAIDGAGRGAALTGMVFSVGRAVDLALHMRAVGVGYRSVDGQIFQQATRVDAERGVFAQFRWRLSGATTLDAFSDQFSLPRAGNTDLSLVGVINGLRLEYRPDKRSAFYIRMQTTRREKEAKGGVLSGVYTHRFLSVRLHGEFPLISNLSMALRAEQVRVNGDAPSTEWGFLTFVEFRYKPPSSAWGIDLRCMWVSTASWESRIYAYERDVLYKTGFPAFSGNLARAYLNCAVPMGRKTMGWIRYEFSKIFVNQLLNMAVPPISDGLTLQVRFVLGDDPR